MSGPMETCIIFSDTEDMDTIEDEFAQVINTDFWSTYCLPFGKFKGRQLGALIATKGGRSYMKYLLEWPELFDVTRENIKAAFNYYEVLRSVDKKTPSRPVECFSQPKPSASSNSSSSSNSISRSSSSQPISAMKKPKLTRASNEKSIGGWCGTY